ncbi:MAG: PBP1A family penicillin-binding protein [Calditrichaeota bacterium]|nr:PBP1A family penicillin-binding protein [Calditrichota bacterium]
MIVSFLLILVIGIGSYFLYQLSKELPSLEKLERIDPEMATVVYSADGEVIHSFFTFNRTFTPYEKIPPYVIDALISTEDRDFFNHWGINLAGIARALLVDLMHFDIKQGASTITMQLARNLYFGYAQTIKRKIKEALTAIQIERTYSKEEILSMYLNITFFGNNAYGIRAAAKRYFDKEVEDLNIQEAALLIGVLNGQTYYSPIRHPERSLRRRNVVLSMMMENGKLTKAEFDSLKQLPLELNITDPYKMKVAPYFTEHVRRTLNQLQDSLGVNIYEDGLRIYTTLDTRIQKYMEMAVAKHIDKIQERVRRQSTFIKLKEELGDSAFESLSTVQLAFVAIDPHTGHILAMIGGRDFDKSKWNRVTQMMRQPGSAFKPFLYTAAIDNGYSPASEYPDLPSVEFNPDSTRWTPQNYSGTFSGKMVTLREALRRSLNSVAVRLIADITPQVVIKYAREMGISTPLPPYSSLALGSADVIPLEIVSAYGIFANNGVHVYPISILKIEDRNGNVIYSAHPKMKEALSPETTYIMNDMLQTVINRGTGVRARTVFKFYKKAGGKTGTTNSYTDAWFIGFTPDIVAGVWVGLDDFKYSLGRGMSGAVAALPFWAEFMKMVYDSLDINKYDFPQCSGVVRLKICKETRLLATPYCPDTFEELFNLKYAPTEKCTKHSEPMPYRKTRRKIF